MGLLTDPNGGQGKLTKLLLNYHGKLCKLSYLIGVIWFCSLAAPQFNSNTYFSENALLPGLVKSTFQQDRLALQYFQELKDETQKYDSSLPYAWLLAKFRQIGLDAYTHNFTLHSPLNPNETFYGKNVYGILRAPRASSTEALVLSVPYRPPSSIHPTTLPSIAIQLAFAKFAVKEKYWAKDIIFLITDHEQLGMQAWLEAYHGVSCGNKDVLNHGDLKGRAGAIQAAINLELHSVRIGYLDIKIEGLNGQLPNLDLFNLAGKICIKEGVFYTFKSKSRAYFRDPYTEWLYYFKNLLAMMTTHATGIPNGNHGLFLRFGIQALTLEGFEQSKEGSRVGLLNIGRVIEGIFRSSNNLLERFHQSFFFYLLPNYDRYISIGLYMPAACMIAAALIIKACAKWFKLQEEDINVAYIKVIVVFVLMHFIGAFVNSLPQIAQLFNYDVSSAIFFGLISVLITSLLVPLVLKDFSFEVMLIFALLELGTTLICLSMNNISLGMFCSVISVPMALIIDITSNKFFNYLQKLLWILIHPFTILFIVVTINSWLLFNQESIGEVLLRAIVATQEAVIYSVADSMIYGNWLYTVVTMVLIPNWLCFWCVTFGRIKSPKNKFD
ncbi:unnamed protein product [Ceutorhynchus assimilis]|uniref:Glycosylphosphatidylinositol anchor attachment 1 protein n=1 Tax=Ceutorhynchus assimilis TaxID=467358 RepID=A0A9N9MZP6_9CUCU|nr:unnamed protein product [Ceutorhynchus assimilis]